jgi:hypothetical protein
MTDTDIAPPRAPVAAAEPLPPENFPLAVAAGLAAAIGGALIWAAVTVATQTEIGIIAVAIGYLVGMAVKAVGHGRSQKFGILGAACGLFGCVLGSLFSDVAFYADQMHIPYAEVPGVLNMSLVGRLMSVFFSPMDLLFYAIAVYEGYRFSFRR